MEYEHETSSATWLGRWRLSGGMRQVSRSAKCAPSGPSSPPPVPILTHNYCEWKCPMASLCPPSSPTPLYKPNTSIWRRDVPLASVCCRICWLREKIIHYEIVAR